MNFMSENNQKSCLQVSNVCQKLIIMLPTYKIMYKNKSTQTGHWNKNNAIIINQNHVYVDEVITQFIL